MDWSRRELKLQSNFYIKPVAISGKLGIQNMFRNIFSGSMLANYSDFSQNGLVSWFFRGNLIFGAE
jgi:hypothetical protein